MSDMAGKEQLWTADGWHAKFGMEADIIALDGDPMTDAAALGRVVFVMRAGEVHRNEPGSGSR